MTTTNNDVVNEVSQVKWLLLVVTNYGYELWIVSIIDGLLLSNASLYLSGLFLAWSFGGYWRCIYFGIGRKQSEIWKPNMKEKD